MLWNERDTQTARAIGELGLCNPFLPGRIALEKEILGSEFRVRPAVWSVDPADLGQTPNIPAINRLAEDLVQRAIARLATGASAGDAARQIFQDLALYVLYYRHEDSFYQLITSPVTSTDVSRRYRDFVADCAALFALPGLPGLLDESPADLFALLFQHRRAFHFTFRQIFGCSMPAAELRAAVWQSIFTHDMRRYRRSLFARMHEMTTLIVGPTGAGKELVARAIGLSRFIPFVAARQSFAEDFRSSYQAINLAALPVTLVESELFGHRKGSFTGAVADRRGYLECDDPWATVFLDEIGDLHPGVQLKLLRVLEGRELQRVGENRRRRFAGKIIAATNVDLAAEISAGRFRVDLYFRLCADMITMPSLAEQFATYPDDLLNLATLVAQRLVGEEDGTRLAREVVDWVQAELGVDYAWPGNMRELEQCVRNVLIRHRYRPPCPAPSASPPPLTELVQAMSEGQLTADELLARYCTWVYARLGTYEAAARRLGLDRRTVKARVDLRWLTEQGKSSQRNCTAQSKKKTRAATGTIRPSAEPTK